MTAINPIFILFRLFPMGIQGIAALLSLFWIWVLVDCITKEPSEGNDKVAWVLFILGVPLVGAVVYYFVRRPERVKELGR